MNEKTPILSIFALSAQLDATMIGNPNPISLNLYPGEIGVMLDEFTGALLLQVIMGEGSITSGSIYFRGEDLTKRFANNTPKPWLKHIGFGFKELGLLANLTLKENVSLPLNYHDKGAQSDRIIEEIFRDLDLSEEHWQQRPHMVSEYTRKKALLARAIVMDPPLILLDEPTLFFSSPQIPHLMKWLGRLKDRKKSILITTKDYPFGMAVADWFYQPCLNKIEYHLLETLKDSPWYHSARALKEAAFTP